LSIDVFARGMSKQNTATLVTMSQEIAAINRLNWQGEYNAPTNYVVDDVVYYAGSSYKCILASTNNLPTDVTYWTPLALKGDAGASSTAINDAVTNTTNAWSGDKVSKFGYKGTIINSTVGDLLTLTGNFSGSYVLFNANPANVTSLPSDVTGLISGTLTVNVGQYSGSVYEKVFTLVKRATTEIWVGISYNGAAITWGKVSSGVGAFLQRADITAGINSYAIVNTGTYKINASCLSDAPADVLTSNNILDVYVYSSGAKSFILHQAAASNGTQKIYHGYKHYNVDTTYWRRLVAIDEQFLYGKTLTLLGDSIMAAVDDTVIATRTGLVVTDNSYAGSSLSLRDDVTYDPYALCTRSKVGELRSVAIENFDYAIIWMGTNDWGHAVPLGTIDSVDEHTVLGAYNVAIQNFISRKADIKIMIVAPMFRDNCEDEGAYPKLSVFNTSIESLAAKYSIPCLNMMKDGSVNDYNKATWLTGDLLHPSNPAGVAMLSNKLAAFINTCY
jgi:hypothetical protein